MAFLDNSGDIILDAVLTDYGRMQLAKNVSNFIVKFALGDDEINYQLWNGSHPSGSAYYDLDIVQTPVLEAFANNASSMKYALYSDTLATNLLYLPVMKAYDNSSNTYFYGNAADASAGVNSTLMVNGGINYYSGSVVLLSANTTTDSDLDAALTGEDEFIKSTGMSQEHNRVLRIDVGLDSDGATRTMLSGLRTSTIMVRYDSRLLSIADKDATILPANSIDDDYVETVLTDSVNFIQILTDAQSYSNASSGALTNTSNGYDCIISLSILPKAALQGNDYYFTLLGRSSETIGSDTFKTIDTNIQIISEDTGTSINIPIKICKS